MELRDTIRIVDALGEPDARSGALARLARHIDADAVLVFVPDQAKLIPAPGSPMPPAIRGWRDLLARCTEPGVVTGDVAYPDARSTTRACAYVFDRLVVVVVGHAEPSSELHEHLGLAARLIATMFASESSLAAMRGEIAMERQAAERTAMLARALDRARGDAERATRVKDEFLAMLGHELRNPLAPIVTALQMLRLDGVHTRAQDVLERQVAHVLRLVDDLLDISRITSGKVELQRQPIEIATVVTRALELVRPLLNERRNKLVVDVPERGLVVDGDAVRLAQIMSNLIANAAKYSDRDSEIAVRASRSGATIRIAVIDHGIGIDPSYIDRVFEQFVQVPQGLDRAAGGLGLGLAIARNLVERHGGNVRATSAGTGRGSTFLVELPASGIGVEHSQPTPARIAEATTTGNILVVDDNCDAADLLAELLAAHGHRVQVANSGPEALASLSGFTPDAAVLDIGLPVMDGYELARRLREQLPELRLIALTGYGQANDRERTHAAGFDRHLVKPVTLANMRRALDELLPRAYS